MNKKRRGKSCIFWGMVFLLVIFALLSVPHLQKSFYVYKAAQERKDKAHSEKEYVETQLEDARAHTKKRQYDTENTGKTEEGKLKKIELRGVTLSPEKNTPFSKNEVRFNVIEQEEE